MPASETHQPPTERPSATSRSWQLLGAEQIALQETPTPVPAIGELVVRLDAALTCGTDLKVYRAGGHARMLRPPCAFGHEMAGTVQTVGGEDLCSELQPDSRPWRPGDRVVVANSASCGHCRPCRSGRENLCADLHYLNGAFGDHLLVPDRFVRRAVHSIGDDLAARDAALAEPLACVLHARELLEADLEAWSRSGEVRCVVFGSGPLGLLLTWALDGFGASVTTVDPNQQRLEKASHLGADTTVLLERVPGQDPPHEPPPDVAGGQLSRSFDLAIDASGSLDGWQSCLRAIHAGGCAVFFGGRSAGALPVRAHRLHYDEIALRGVYHHRPETFAGALETLRKRPFDPRLLVDLELDITQLPEALAAMAQRRALKVLLAP